MIVSLGLYSIYCNRFFTFFICTVPSAPPANFRLDSVGLSSITVTWERVPASHRNGYVIGYRVKYTKYTAIKSDTREFNSLDTAWNVFKATITKLEKDTLYIMQVAGFTSKGDGVYTKTIITRTKKCKL